MDNYIVDPNGRAHTANRHPRGWAIAAGLHLPARVGWRELLVVGCIASIGLVFALFFAAAVMPVGPLLLQIKMGALVTIAEGGLAFAAARLLRVGRFAR